MTAKLPDYGCPGQKSLSDAMRYSCDGGKRIRAVLALAVCELLGGEQRRALPVAAAVEFIHAYSLIHDDLPCMDNDDLRRGKPSCHKAFGEATALLAGDALLNLAFEVLLDAVAADSAAGVSAPGCRAPGGAALAAQIVARASGSQGMAGGQAVDLLGGAENLEQLRRLHSLKTGRLISAAALAPAAMLGAEGLAEGSLRRYAENIGLAFQIKDDMLDVSGDAGKMGKAAGRDAKSRKTTYVSLLGYDAAERHLSEACARAREALAPFGAKSEFLRELAEYVAKREG
jgi:geranylgeranyl diphosphate synthase type II